MGACGAVISGLEGEEDVIEVAKHLERLLELKPNLSLDEKKVLVALGSRLCSLVSVDEQNGEGISDTEMQLNAIYEHIMSWETDQSMIWDSGAKDFDEYLNLVSETQKLIERLESSGSKNSEETELLRKAHDVLQTAMERLEEEFRHMLVQKMLPLEFEDMSFRSREEDVAEDGSVASYGIDSVEESVRRNSITTGEIIELIQPNVIPDMRNIVNLMSASNYDHECNQIYILARKDALEECLLSLEVEKLSIEDVLKMESRTLHSTIKRWIHVMKIFVRVYLASEKDLSDQIFHDLGTVSLSCFFEASKSSVLQLLNFAEAIAISPRQPDNLYKVLDMYEVLAELLEDTNGLFAEETGLSIRVEYEEVMSRLGDCVKATCIEFENKIESNVSLIPFPGGGVHPLTKFVMNYLNVLTDYRETLDMLLKDGEASLLPSPDTSTAAEDDTISRSSSSIEFPAVALHFQSATSVLESNLNRKSKLYRDVALQQFFLMNNVYYMARKVKNSELQLIFGGTWVRKHNWKVQNHAMEYEKFTWWPLLNLLKDEGGSKKPLKEKFRSFSAAFEEIYKTQTAWVIADHQLREDLRISASLKVIQAYRPFYDKNKNIASDRHIKYNPSDLENHLLDLFAGSPRSLTNSHKK